MKDMAVQSAIFAEPAGAAAFAGLQKMMRAHAIGRDETVVVIVTGSGLKDAPSAMRVAGQPHVIEPTLAAVRRALA